MIAGETARVLSNTQAVERVASSPSSSNPASIRGTQFAQEEGTRVRFNQQDDSLSLSGATQAGQSQGLNATNQTETENDVTSASQTEENNLLSQVEERVQGALEDAASDSALEVRFRRDDDTGASLVQFVEPESGEVVRQFPPEDVLKFASRFQDLTGDLFSTQAEDPSVQGGLVNDQA